MTAPRGPAQPLQRLFEQAGSRGQPPLGSIAGKRCGVLGIAGPVAGSAAHEQVLLGADPAARPGAHMLEGERTLLMIAAAPDAGGAVALDQA